MLNLAFRIMAQNPKFQNQNDDAAQDFATRWAKLNEAGQEIGSMAALGREEMTDELAGFPEAIEAIGSTRWAIAQDTLADIDAILQPGLTALHAIRARGQDTTAPALALWREFHASRSSLLALARTAGSTQEPVPA